MRQVLPRRWPEGQFEREGRAFARSVALGRQRSAQFPGGQQAAVQAENRLAVFPGGKTVSEDFGKIFRHDARAIVTDGDAHPAVAAAHAERNELFLVNRFLAGVLGVLIRFTRICRTLCFSTVISGICGSYSRTIRSLRRASEPESIRRASSTRSVIRTVSETPDSRA